MNYNINILNAIFFGSIGAAMGIKIYASLIKERTYIQGEVSEIFLPLQTLSKIARKTVEEMIDFLKKNEITEVAKYEKKTQFEGSIVLWDAKGVPIKIHSHEVLPETDDGELEAKDRYNIPKYPDPLCKDELELWKKIANKGGGWCVKCENCNLSKINMEFMYVQEWNNILVTSGYFI
tara:strand:+ start:111 stop:644 length:534 start_codon:yes stop_codon:yes gene_type:complete